MTVDTSSPATAHEGQGKTFYFCSLRCRDRFEREHELAHRVVGDPAKGDPIDPVGSMRVFSRDALRGVGPDQVTYYFCSEGCARRSSKVRVLRRAHRSS